MKHLIKGRKLNKTTAHRKAMFSNMANSMLKHTRIKTTLAKAKEFRRYIERMITRAKNDTLHNKRIILRFLRHRTMIEKLFTQIAPKFKDRNGGYTRIIKLGRRKNDNAEMAIIEFVEDFSVAPQPEKTETKKKITPEKTDTK